MTEGIIAAIIGVLVSVGVFIASLIANNISYKKQVKFEKKRAITDKLCGMIYKNN